jgi:dTDP-4-amino-4,6-dideoxygalactose transaminase
MTSIVEKGVPLCDLQTQYRMLQPQVEAAVLRVLASCHAILGPENAGLEREVAEYCGTKHGIACASGTDALLLALQALGIGPGDEVILPPFTFFATAGSVCRLGAAPVFADVDPETFNLDPIRVESKITRHTKAIIAVHLFGQCADMGDLSEIGDCHGLPIIEDAAQAIGADFGGKRAGNLGAIGCFSFYPSKTLGAYGDGGLAVTNNPDWAKRMACLRVHGMEPKYYHQMIGWNARLDEVQAAILRVKLPHLEGWITARQQVACRYDALIEKSGLSDFLERPSVRSDRRHTFNQYVVRVANGQRDALVAHLKANRIGCEIYYPVPLHLQKCLGYLGYRAGDFPISEEATRCVLALPMFPELTEAQQVRVIEVCADFVRGQMRRTA